MYDGQGTDDDLEAVENAKITKRISASPSRSILAPLPGSTLPFLMGELAGTEEGGFSALPLVSLLPPSPAAPNRSHSEWYHGLTLEVTGSVAFRWFCEDECLSRAERWLERGSYCLRGVNALSALLYWIVTHNKATNSPSLELARVIILIPAVLLFDEEPVPARLPSPMVPPFLAALPLGPGLDSTSWHSSRARGRYTAPDMQSSRVILALNVICLLHIY